MDKFTELRQNNTIALQNLEAAYHAFIQADRSARRRLGITDTVAVPLGTDTDRTVRDLKEKVESALAVAIYCQAEIFCARKLFIKETSLEIVVNQVAEHASKDYAIKREHSGMLFPVEGDFWLHMHVWEFGPWMYMKDGKQKQRNCDWFHERKPAAEHTLREYFEAIIISYCEEAFYWHGLRPKRAPSIFTLKTQPSRVALVGDTYKEQFYLVIFNVIHEQPLAMDYHALRAATDIDVPRPITDVPPRSLPVTPREEWAFWHREPLDNCQGEKADASFSKALKGCIKADRLTPAAPEIEVLAMDELHEPSRKTVLSGLVTDLCKELLAKRQYIDTWPMQLEDTLDEQELKAAAASVSPDERIAISTILNNLGQSERLIYLGRVIGGESFGSADDSAEYHRNRRKFLAIEREVQRQSHDA